MIITEFHFLEEIQGSNMQKCGIDDMNKPSFSFDIFIIVHLQIILEISGINVSIMHFSVNSARVVGYKHKPRCRTMLDGKFIKRALHSIITS